MAVEKGLVLTAIENKFKGKSLSKTFKDNLATKWAAKIDTDADIDEYINDREDIVIEASIEADKRATDARTKALAEGKKPEPNNEPKPTDLPDDLSPAMKQFFENQNKLIEGLANKVSGFETAQTSKSLEERFKTNPELKGIPELFFKGRIPTTEEGFEASVQELKADYTAFAEANKLSNIGLDNPGGGNQKPNPVDAAIPAEVKAFAEKNLKPSSN